MSFYNRMSERAALKTVLGSNRAELFILYGRRGAGKSALMEAALSESGLAHLYYRATRRTLQLQLASLTDAAREAFPEQFIPQPFASLTIFLDWIRHVAEERLKTGSPAPVVVVIDELPYLAEVDHGLLTVLQHWWDANRKQANIKLFLSGSYLAFMERRVLDVSAPLYNRRTGAMKLDAMDYADSGLFFPRYPPEEKMQAYAILGGMPSYLEQFDPGRGIEENVRATILRRNTYLSEEPDWLLLEELRRDVTHGSILRAIASGERKPSDIARAIGKHSAQEISPALETLRQLGFVIREVPVTERSRARSRNSLYFLADHYLAFWYRYVDPDRSLLARGMGDRIWAKRILPTLQEHISHPPFERACRQYLWRALERDRLPPGVEFSEVGNWWGAGDREIDVVAVDSRERIVLTGSCKWTTGPMDVREYAALQRDVPLAGAAADEPWLVLFSRSGFTPRLRSLAAESDLNRLLLVDLREMYAVSE
ncbi:MAG TPA: ATP-binding protein [Armatimonadota bacterium]|nr:ATP-binding protein [Armatimonadota bacterium]